MRVAGALQVFMGTSILLTISGIFSSDQAGLLALFYVCGAFQLACGIIALALSKKKTKIPIVLGVLLFIPQALRFLLPSSGTISIVINAVSLVGRAYNLLRAYLKYRDYCFIRRAAVILLLGPQTPAAQAPGPTSQKPPERRPPP